MKPYKYLVSLTFLLFAHAHLLQGQDKGLDNVVGKNYFIKSEVLNEEREIQVYLPNDYSENETTDYPVLYIIDGQRFFLYGVSLNISFTQFDLTPKFIVVGIKNKYPQRFGHFTRGSVEFLKFLENEVVEFVDVNFRTNQERLLFGWEYAGSFALKALIERPSLFDAYFLASPYPIKERIKSMDSVLSSETFVKTGLYFSVSPSEGEVNKGIGDLRLLLKDKNNQALTWEYLDLQNAEHRSTPYATLYNGLRKHYNTYPELQIDNLDDFIEAGEVNYAVKYTKGRSEQYGFSSELSDWTKFTIIRSAIRADNFEKFQSYLDTFMDASFIEGLRGNRPYSIAEFCEKNKNYDKAIVIYKILERKYPDSSKPLNALGNAYKSLNNSKEAEKYFKKAKEVSEN